MMNQLQNSPNVGTPSFCASKRNNNNHKKQSLNNVVSKPNNQPKPQDIRLKNDEPQVKSVAIEVEDEEPLYYDVYKTPEAPKKSHKGRDAVLGSLMAMAAVAMPTAILLDDNKSTVVDSSYNIELVAPPEPFAGAYCDAEAVAIGGENDTIVEPAEIMQFLDYSRLSTLPEEEQDSIKARASRLANPVNAHEAEAGNKVIDQVRGLQKVVDAEIEKSPHRPSMQYGEAGQAEYERKYITSAELVNSLDYSEILKYQKDASVLRAGIRDKMQKIRRDDAKALEKFEAEREKAQRIIDNIVDKYKMNSNITGNADCDNTITVKEVANMIDTSVIGHLPRYEQKRVIKEALGSFKTIVFQELKTEEDIQKVNERIEAEVQKVQDKLDRRAVPMTYRWSMQ